MANYLLQFLIQSEEFFNQRMPAAQGLPLQTAVGLFQCSAIEAATVRPSGEPQSSPFRPVRGGLTVPPYSFRNGSNRASSAR